MGTGIIVCGLNGSGKSTLGKALAKRLDFYFIDNEDLYFPKMDNQYPYASPRTYEEAKNLLFHEIKVHENFVFASVKGNYGKEISPFFQLVVLIDVAKDVRMNELEAGPSKNSAIECCRAEICTIRKKNSLLLLNPALKIQPRNGQRL